MENPAVSPFQKTPEALNAVGVSLSPNILTNRMLDRFMVRQSMIGERVIGVDLRSRRNVLHDESAHGLTCGIGNNFGLNLIAGPVFDPGYGCFSNRPASCQFGLPLLAHVPAFSSHVGFIYFYRTRKGLTIFAGVPTFPDAVEHEPGGRLTDSDVPAEFHTADTLEAGEFQIDGNGPFSQRKVGFCNWGSSPDAEVFAAVPAMVRHRLAVRNLTGGDTATVSTAPLLRPEGLLKPSGGDVFAREHFRDLEERDSFPVGFSRSLSCLFSHMSSIKDWRGNVKWVL